ncbi:uncharacterized protein [Aristolochia californica]|uniref:uncharacterized protein n=1 Tax=Aristolochia californica TaxID=171875 RepID=UPI0035DB6EF5
MVPARFAWSYGGRQIFLSGSFDRWTESIPMTLVEGSSTVFHAICNLAPGYHQALQMGYQANGTSNGARQCHTCLPSDSFHEILERFSDPAVRRLIVIEPHNQRVEGVISLRDVFSFFLG